MTVVPGATAETVPRMPLVVLTPAMAASVAVQAHCSVTSLVEPSR